MSQKRIKERKRALLNTFEPVSIFTAEYEVEKKHIGKGNFAAVYRAAPVSGSGDLRAVKILELNKVSNAGDIDSVENEIKILQKIDHPGVVQLFDVFSNNAAMQLWVVEQYGAGGQLLDRIIARSERGLYNELEAATIVRNITDALAYMHERKIVHRDVKPENILMKSVYSETDILIADFGFAAEFSEDHPLIDQCGSPVYASPEVIRGKPYFASPDMWSLGVIVYILLCGYAPFYHNDQAELLKMVVKRGFTFHPDPWDKMSNASKDFIRGLLKKKINMRMTAPEAMKHEWLNQIKEEAPQMFNRQITINAELRKFRAEQNLMKAFGVIQVLELMKQLAAEAELANETSLTADSQDTGETPSSEDTH